MLRCYTQIYGFNEQFRVVLNELFSSLLSPTPPKRRDQCTHKGPCVVLHDMNFLQRIRLHLTITQIILCNVYTFLVDLADHYAVFVRWYLANLVSARWFPVIGTDCLEDHQRSEVNIWIHEQKRFVATFTSKYGQSGHMTTWGLRRTKCCFVHFV